MPKWQCKFNDVLASKYSAFKKARNEFEAECRICAPRTYISVSNKSKEKKGPLNVSILPVLNKHFADVLDHMTPIFLEDEPLSQCFPPSMTERREHNFRTYAEAHLHSGLSFVAVDGNKIVGACLNSAITRDEVMSHPLPSTIEPTEEDLLIPSVVRMVVTVHRQLDLFTALEVDKLFEVALVSVARTHRKKGLATLLIKTSLEFAARQGFQGVKVDSTGPASSRASEKAGLVAVYKLPYDDYKVDGKIVFKRTPTRGPALTVMAARLQNVQPYVLPVTLKSKCNMEPLT